MNTARPILARELELIKKLVFFLMTLMSLFCLLAVPGAFVQALLLVYVIYIVCGVMAICGNIKIAAINIFILSVAVALSPVTDMNLIYKHYLMSGITLVTAVFAFSGLIIGVNKLQKKVRNRPPPK